MEVKAEWMLGSSVSSLWMKTGCCPWKGTGDFAEGCRWSERCCIQGRRLRNEQEARKWATLCGHEEERGRVVTNWAGLLLLIWGWVLHPSASISVGCTLRWKGWRCGGKVGSGWQWEAVEWKEPQSAVAGWSDLNQERGRVILTFI